MNEDCNKMTIEELHNRMQRLETLLEQNIKIEGEKRIYYNDASIDGDYIEIAIDNSKDFVIFHACEGEEFAMVNLSISDARRMARAILDALKNKEK